MTIWLDTVSNCAHPIAVRVGLTDAAFAGSQVGGRDGSEERNGSINRIFGEKRAAQIFTMAFGTCPDCSDMTAARDCIRISGDTDRLNCDVWIGLGNFVHADGIHDQPRQYRQDDQPAQHNTSPFEKFFHLILLDYSYVDLEVTRKTG